MTINCGSLPEQVVESELFGHTKGAFTGAGSSRRGLLRSAHKGTLLLDEVNSMSLDAQARLLRFLETGELRAVGSDAPQTVDTWIIAATNTDLRRAAETGAFRKDLMYRLDYLRLDVPPLRCRGDDVKLLAQHFLRNISGTAVDFSEGAYAAIADYDWPGNVRELRNRVEAAALMVDKPVITEEDLALPATQHPCVASPYGLSDRLWELVQDSGMSLGEAIAFCEELLIREALDREENNRTRAAHRLRIHVRTIFKKLAPSCARTPGARPPKDPPGAP